MISNTKRLVISASVGAVFATIDVLFSENFIHTALLGLVFLFLVGLITPKEVSSSRRVKFVLAFFVISTFIGGAVNYTFSFLDEIIDFSLIDNIGGAENKNLLILSLIVLLMIGVLKIILALFTHTAIEKNAKVEITLMGKTAVFEGLVDSGNMLLDPIDSTPVMLIKKEKIKKYFPLLCVDLNQISLVKNVNAFKMRLIPIRLDGKSRILVGAKPQKAYIINNRKKERVDITIAIDSQEGNYGGYFALIPLATIENVI
jgi:sigma-E processing peptidase SpoIIGA